MYKTGALEPVVTLNISLRASLDVGNMGVYRLIAFQQVVLADICRVNIAQQIIGLQFIL